MYRSNGARTEMKLHAMSRRLLNHEYYVRVEKYSANLRHYSCYGSYANWESSPLPAQCIEPCKFSFNYVVKETTVHYNQDLYIVAIAMATGSSLIIEMHGATTWLVETGKMATQFFTYTTHECVKQISWIPHLCYLPKPLNFLDLACRVP